MATNGNGNSPQSGTEGAMVTSPGALGSPSPQGAGGRANHPIIPRTMDELARVAVLIKGSGMAPRGLETVEKIGAAVMMGAELGLLPWQSLRWLKVINGMPSINGDGAMAMVRASGKAKYIKEYVKDNVYICETVRRDDPTIILRTFNQADAKRAGLWGKSGPWTQYPERMLMYRARGFCLRDAYPDVLGGMYLAEELMGAEPWQQPPPPPPPRGGGNDDKPRVPRVIEEDETLEEAPVDYAFDEDEAPPPPPVPDEQQEAPVHESSGENILDAYDGDLYLAQDIATLTEIADQYEDEFSKRPRKLREAAEAIYDKHNARLRGG